ncbi:hypothetical protein NH44784_027561 [Achromobacter xylosoxidans NH44784-1996]|nr:hypothetical protein NH44784_027561 [Achromobacter xylosoxidans NH44784-1996]
MTDRRREPHIAALRLRPATPSGAFEPDVATILGREVGGIRNGSDVSPSRPSPRSGSVARGDELPGEFRSARICFQSAVAQTLHHHAGQIEDTHLATLAQGLQLGIVGAILERVGSAPQENARGLHRIEIHTDSRDVLHRSRLAPRSPGVLRLKGTKVKPG